MDWLTGEPPSRVEVAGEPVPIRTGWRHAVRSYAITGSGRPLSQLDVTKLLAGWFRDGEVTGRVVSAHRMEALSAALSWRDSAIDETMPYGDGSRRPSPARVFDWEADSGIVVADFRRLYGIDLRAWKAHWWDFRLLFDALLAMPDSLVAAAAYARSPLGSGSGGWERDRHRDLARAWALPPTEAELVQRMREAW